MPPSLPTPEQVTQLAQSNARLADAVLSLSQANTRLAKQVERQAEVLDQTRQAIAKTLENRDVDQFALQSLLREIQTNMALMASNVNNVERDVREATNPRLHTHTPTEDEGDRRAGAVVRFIRIFSKTSFRTQVLIIVLAGVMVTALAIIYAK